MDMAFGKIFPESPHVALFVWFLGRRVFKRAEEGMYGCVAVFTKRTNAKDICLSFSLARGRVCIEKLMLLLHGVLSVLLWGRWRERSIK
jgi:hypothetical protein